MNVKNMAFCNQPKALHDYYHDYTSNDTYLHFDLTAASADPSYFAQNTVELNISILIGAASIPDMQKIRIIRFFFENSLHWQSEVWLLLFKVRTRG
jgi:hypothetical protein